MEFASQLQIFSKQVDGQIQDILMQWEKETHALHPKLNLFTKVFTTASTGGKRVRSFLVKTGYDLIASKKQKDIIRVAAAIEILHTAILAHDDIIDASPLRRGKPTIYKQLGGDTYGIAQAISLGDAGFFLGLKTLYTTSFSEQTVAKAASCLFSSLEQTMFGQLLDVSFSKGFQKTEEDVETIQTLKTAQYTFVSPLVMGAILAGAEKQMLKKLTDFGEKAGIAFQIKDDMLGVFGEKKELGKSVYSDIQEGKNTLLISYALEHATTQQKKFLKKHYGNIQINETIYTTIKDIFVSTGAVTYAQKKMEQYKHEAEKVIPYLTAREKERKVFYELLDFITERKS